MTVNTKKAERRAVELHTLDDILAEVDRLEAAHNAGTLARTGNWDAGQILWHCAAVFRASLDGFPENARPPLWLRLFGRLIKGKATAPGGEAPTGFKIPKELADAFLPSDTITFERGTSDLRGAIGRVKAGERMEVPSPIFGAMTHEQWTNLHLGHCQMHFSFLDPGD